MSELQRLHGWPRALVTAAAITMASFFVVSAATVLLGAVPATPPVLVALALATLLLGGLYLSVAMWLAVFSPQMRSGSSNDPSPQRVDRGYASKRRLRDALIYAVQMVVIIALEGIVAYRLRPNPFPAVALLLAALLALLLPAFGLARELLQRPSSATQRTNHLS